MPVVSDITVLAKAPGLDTGPDSITLANGDIWVEYSNGASSTGGSGNSTIVEYDPSGDIDNFFEIAGSVDGLKYDPFTGQIWALQNQDGNSTLTIIDPVSGTTTGPLQYAQTSSTRGFDDVVFTRHTVYLSYTNPVDKHSAVIVVLENGNHPEEALQIKPILYFGAEGINTETGRIGEVPLSDPDSLKMAPNHDLILTSGGDNTIIDVHNPGMPTQQISFTKVHGVPDGSLDDVIRPGARSGTFYVADTADNRILSFHASHLHLHDYYVSVGNAFGQVNPFTGRFTALIDAANAPGAVFGKAHGAVFIPDGHALPDTSGLHHGHGVEIAGIHSSANDGWLFA
jgi:hypothetical protein